MAKNTLTLGDRMKAYEHVLDFKLNPCMQYVIRLDGKGFSKMIKKWKCEKPFDERFNKAMNYASRKIFDILQGIHCIWHGSDEISIWFSYKNVEDMYYEGRIQKLISLVASNTSVYFNKKLQEEFGCELPFGIFDARIMQFPNEIEIANYFLFRQRDHIRNSISGYSQYYFSHKEVNGKNSQEKIDMMKIKGFDYNTLSDDKMWSKYGTLLWKQDAYIYQDNGDFYQRTYIASDTKCDFSLNKVEIIIKPELCQFTEEQWKEIKENEY